MVPYCDNLLVDCLAKQPLKAAVNANEVPSAARVVKTGIEVACMAVKVIIGGAIGAQ